MRELSGAMASDLPVREVEKKGSNEPSPEAACVEAVHDFSHDDLVHTDRYRLAHTPLKPEQIREGI